VLYAIMDVSAKCVLGFILLSDHNVIRLATELDHHAGIDGVNFSLSSNLPRKRSFRTAWTAPLNAGLIKTPSALCASV
jgi:hypothetical protein